MFIFKNKKESVSMLPITTEGLDKFVKEIVQEYELPDSDDSYEAIAGLILRMPGDCMYAPKKHFGHSVLKQLANKAAFEKIETFMAKRKAEHEAKELAKKSEVNPKDGLTVEPPIQN